MMDKPDVDSIEGLSPAIAIEQKATSHNPRSTVGTVTEIYDYLRLLFARAGIPRCPDHLHRPHGADREPDGRPGAAAARRHRGRSARAAVSDRKGEHAEVLEDPGGTGVCARAHRRPHPRDGSAAETRSQAQTHDRGRGRPHARAARMRRNGWPNPSRPRCGCPADWRGSPSWTSRTREELVFSSQHACPVCGYSVPPLEPKLFSFNNPAGACPTCDGLGTKEFFDPQRVVVHPAPVARGRRDPRLGSPQRALLPAHPVARPSLRLRHRDAVDRAAREGAKGPAVRQRR